MLNSLTAPGFDDPLELLRACHGKILRQCETLCRLAEHLKTKGCDPEAQKAAQGILRYFSTAGRLHHQDEELDLFPALSATKGAAAQGVATLLERLLAEHLDMQASWDALQPLLGELASGQPVALPDDVVQRFIVCHTRHIALENGELLPLAAQLLNADQLGAMGRKMAARRGVEFVQETG